ncbi:GNAT family N-acetyltransferase [Amycolatopsis suaedae]|uniref:GNAT family N-acetyltransferase n=1 Tax=Amycolatopsis suaedae TaxID=2510978 RepID=A0A4Q7JET6_9PSEU|nr:GNAT family N-acetyltransferase [Amycolatopsis suaedae]RZQ66079.1 GNAT family N-acetyltransferase [Amycolatopsis suaedae]
MSDHILRPLKPEELRAAATLFRATLHVGPFTDEEWERTEPVIQPDRVFGVLEGETLIGTARSTDTELTVPGGARIPLAAVTGVGVRADRTRRGLLTELMRAQFEDFRERGVVAALLLATETGIYERFGYGSSTLTRSFTVDARNARFRPEVPAGGELELLDADEAAERLPGVYASLPPRPGAIGRAAYWWRQWRNDARRSDRSVLTVLHRGSGSGEADGYAVYKVDRSSGLGTLTVLDLRAANAGAYAGLWRYLLGVDLVGEIALHYRPADEPLPLLFTDPRVCVAAPMSADETWLRLIDVEAALTAHRRGPATLRLEVADPVLEHNSGCYEIDQDGVRRVDGPAQLRLGAATLATLYQGTWLPSVLAGAGRIEVLDEAGLEAADRLFAARHAPWCGTFF